jgi:hypothetical protein
VSEVRFGVGAFVCGPIGDEDPRCAVGLSAFALAKAARSRAVVGVDDASEFRIVPAVRTHRLRREDGVGRGLRFEQGEPNSTAPSRVFAGSAFISRSLEPDGAAAALQKSF